MKIKGGWHIGEVIEGENGAEIARNVKILEVWKSKQISFTLFWLWFNAIKSMVALLNELTKEKEICLLKKKSYI